MERVAAWDVAGAAQTNASAAATAGPTGSNLFGRVIPTPSRLQHRSLF
jgi:hypothetical protein